MSRRHEIARRIDALGDIAAIIAAMKGLALMEIRSLGDLLSSQRQLLGNIEQVGGEFLASHPRYAIDPALPIPELCVVVGSEQGFCGDFNDALLAQMGSLRSSAGAPLHWLPISRRLGQRLGARADTEAALGGAIVADEVPAVLLRLTHLLSALLARPALNGFGLSALYHCDHTRRLRLRRLLPLRDLPAPAPHPYPCSAELNLPPDIFLQGLSDHYLHAALNDILYSSLMAENRQRHAHMEQALHRLNDDTAKLHQTLNLRRQEEITEEIEVILLSAGMLATQER